MLDCKKINEINFQNKVAIIRVDFNVPLQENLEVFDTTRIDNGIKSIKYILKNKGKCVIMSHLGRPKGEGYEKKFSLENILSYLEKKLNIKIPLIKDYYESNYSVNKFLEKDVKPFVKEFESEDKYPQEIADKMAELGLFGATISPEYGGLVFGLPGISRLNPLRDGPPDQPAVPAAL